MKFSADGITVDIEFDNNRISNVMRQSIIGGDPLHFSISLYPTEDDTSIDVAVSQNNEIISTNVSKNKYNKNENKSLFNVDLSKVDISGILIIKLKCISGNKRFNKNIGFRLGSEKDEIKYYKDYITELSTDDLVRISHRTVPGKKPGKPPEKPPQSSDTLDTLIIEGASTKSPVFLIPFQIETRIFDDYLKIRVFPDQIAIDNLKRKLTQKEYFDGQEFNADRTIESWRSLTGKYRPGRAAWIAKEAIGIDEEYEFSENENLFIPKIRLLPKYFVLSLHLDNGQVLRYQSKNINESGLDFISPGSEGLFSGDANWVTDFNKALDLGMAFLVDRSELQGIDVINKITVVGVRPNHNNNIGFDLLTNTFESHYYSSEASFIPYGTPTNNTEEKESGITSDEDIEDWYQREFESDSGEINNAREMAKALGLDAELFSKWKYSTNKTNAITKSLYSSLWPSTIEYFINTFLKEILSEGSLDKLKNHFLEYVRPLGFLPSIKIGKNPYGILPITQLNNASIDNPYGWNNATMDSKHLKGDESEWLGFDNKFHSMVNALAKDWLNASNSYEIPKVFNSDSENTMDEVISQILAMSPSSLNYSLRSFHESYFSDVVVRIIVDLIFFEYTETLELSDDELLELYTQFQYNMEGIGDDWLSMKVDLAEKLSQYLSDVMDDESLAENIKKSLLSNLHTFGNYREHPFPLVRDQNNSEDCPENYLLKLTEVNPDPNASNTLLYKLLYRSKYLSSDVNNKENTATILEDGVTKLFRTLDSFEKLTKVNLDLDLKLKEEEVGAIASSIRSARERDVLNDIHDFENIVSPQNSAAWEKLLNSVLTDISEADLEAQLKGILDVTSFRLDAWISSLANKRLDSMRRVKGAENDIIVGGYGVLENLRLIKEPYDTLQGGFIHAPSIAHASTSAILKNAFMSKANDDANPYCFNISSDRIRRALSILSGLREKQNLGELLGYQFERALHDNNLDKYKDEFRDLFNMQEADESEAESQTEENKYSRNVVNGLKLISHDSDYSSIVETASDKSVIDEIILNIRDSVDAISDLMMQESVHQAVNGNYERCGAALDTASGNSFPIEPESVSVPLPKVTVGHRICLLFDTNTDEGISNPSPRERAEPKLAKWFANLLGDTSKIGCITTYLTTSEIETTDEEGNAVTTINYDKNEQAVTISDLLLKPIDFLYLSANRPNMGATEIERRIREFVILKHPETYEDDEKKIKIDFTQYSDIPLNNAIELSNQVLNILGGYKYLKPDDIYKETEKPADELHVDESTVTESPKFSTQDLEEIFSRVTVSYDNLIIIKNQLDLFIEPLLIGVNYYNATKSIKTLISSVYNDDIENLPSINELADLLTTTFDNNYPTVSDYLSETYKTTLEESINTQKDQEDFSLWKVVEQTLDQLLLGVFKTEIADNEHISQENQTDINSSQSLERAIITFVDNLEDEMLSIIEVMRNYGFSLDYYERIKLDIIFPISEVLNKRVTKAESIFKRVIDPDSVAEDKISEQVDLLISCAKSIFGEGFIILPNFTMPDSAGVESIVDNQNDVLKGNGASRIHLWLQQVAQTHKQVDSFEELLLFTEAWSANESTILKPIVIPLPSSDVTEWQALSNEELDIDSNSKRPKGSLSVTLFSSTNNLTEKVSGLHIDQWEDVLPLEEVDTAISFHADTPNQKPANCCLLAVPSERNEKIYDWNILDLEKIVCDALDLAKIRSVDLDAMPDIHGLIPSIYMPKDDEQDKHPKEYIFAQEIGIVSTSTDIRGNTNADN